jgi:hypothetical protein
MMNDKSKVMPLPFNERELEEKSFNKNLSIDIINEMNTNKEEEQFEGIFKLVNEIYMSKLVSLFLVNKYIFKKQE